MTLFHSHFVRVYQEDIDAGGSVYHSNYIKYAERARSKWLRKEGMTQLRLSQEDACYFVVKTLMINYYKASKRDDELEVRSGPTEIQGIRLIIPQKIYQGQTLCVDMLVTLVLINEHNKPICLPPRILKIFVAKTQE